MGSSVVCVLQLEAATAAQAVDLTNHHGIVLAGPLACRVNNRMGRNCAARVKRHAHQRENQLPQFHAAEATLRDRVFM